MVGVGTSQSCGLRKTALEFVRQDEPTDAGALGTRECVLFARVMELVDVPDSKSGGCEAVRVRVPPWAYSEGHKQQYFYQNIWVILR